MSEDIIKCNKDVTNVLLFFDCKQKKITAKLK